MADKIQRQTQKIFGGNAPSDSLAVFGSMITGNPIYTDNIETLQSEAYEEGWESAIAANEAPFLEEMNGVQYGFSKQLAYIFQEGIAEYDPGTTYFKCSIVKVLNADNAPVLYYSLTDNNLGNNPTEDTTNWKEITFGGSDSGSGTSLPLFTPVFQDHVLTGEEAKGYALQGTYVNKNSSPEIAGYPTFYDRCLEEKAASNPQLSSIHGALTYNNGILSGFNSNSENYAVISDVSFNPGSANWEAVFAFNTGELVEGSPWIINDDKACQAFSLAKHSTGVFWCGGFVNNTSTYSFSLVGTHQVAENTDYLIKITHDSSGYKMFISTDDGVTWLSDATSTSTTAITAANLRIGGFERDLPFKGTFNCNKSYIKIGETRFDNFWKYTNPNGHIFYDIADKDIVDNYFASTGIAWLYGIDSENERIFLPRAEICNFAQGKYPTTIPVGGNGKTLGFTNGPYNYGMSLTGNTENTCILHTQDYAQPIPSNNTTGYASGTPAASTRIGMTTDSSKSGVVAYTSGLAPLGATSYLYIVVGNTEQESAITDVTEVTTSENDTIPLGYSLYQGEGAQPSASWLASHGQWNDGNLYTTFYNWAVTKIGQVFAAGTVVESNNAYTDYDLVINQDNMTFRLPILNGNEDLPSTKKLGYPKPTKSGQTYIADFNGLIQAQASTTATNQYVQVMNNITGVIDEIRNPLTNNYIEVSVEVKKGDTFAIYADVISNITSINLHKYQGNGVLYFKVANAVQNLELLDAGAVLEELSNKVDINTPVIDGQWVAKVSDILTSTATKGTYNIDLSNYLPNDNFCYEVMVCGQIYSSSGSYASAHISTPLMAEKVLAHAGGNNRTPIIDTIVPVNKSHSFTFRLTENITSWEGAPLRAVAYRRIGTNK